MRSYSEFEKKVLQYMVDNKEPKGVLGCVVIEKFAEAILLDWNNEDHIKIVSCTNQNIDEIRQNLFDLIALFKYLSKEDYIYCFPAKLIKDKTLYNREKYNVSKRDDGLYEVFASESSVKLNGQEYNQFYYLSIQMRNEVSEIGKELETWVNSSYHVTENLKGFVKNKFKTEEQMHYEESMRWTKISVWVAGALGLTSLLINIFI